MSIKKIFGKLSWWLVRCFLFIVRISPPAFLYAFVDCIVFLAIIFPWKRKTLAMNNMKIVFPNISKKEQKALFKKFLRNMLRNYFDIMILKVKKLSPEKILAMAEADNLQELDNALAKGKGIILFSGHFGSFPLMIIWLSVKGYPVGAVYKEASNFPDDIFGNLMKTYGVTPIKYTLDVGLAASIIRSLKQNKIILIQSDQSKPDGVYINFFNKYVPAAPGPVVLKKRTGAALVPAYIYRKEKRFHHIHIDKEMQLQEGDTMESFITLNTQMLSNWTGEVVIKHPEEWLWLHNRWKREKPLPAQKNISI